VLLAINGESARTVLVNISTAIQAILYSPCTEAIERIASGFKFSAILIFLSEDKVGLIVIRFVASGVIPSLTAVSYSLFVNHCLPLIIPRVACDGDKRHILKIVSENQYVRHVLTPQLILFDNVKMALPVYSPFSVSW
jgi:hypothetical protein